MCAVLRHNDDSIEWVGCEEKNLRELRNQIERGVGIEAKKMWWTRA